MKTHLYIFVLLLCMATSCKTTHTCVITGQPGTRIYYPDGTYITQIASDGTAMVTFDRKSKEAPQYCSFLQAQTPGSNKRIPFGLDFTYNNFKKEKTTTAILYAAGAACLAAGITTACVADKTAISLGLGLPLICASEAFLITGWMPLLNQINPAYSFDLNNQQINDDLIR